MPDASGAGIPESYPALTVRCNDGLRSCLKDRFQYSAGGLHRTRLSSIARHRVKAPLRFVLV